MLEILETKHKNETALIQNCKDLLESLRRFVKMEELHSHSTVEELLILPFLSHEDYRMSFITEQAAKTKRFAKGVELSHDQLAALYLSDPAYASVWHHHAISGPRVQTRYGVASKDELGEYFLEWDTKASVLALIDGFSDVVAHRMKKEGKLNSFLD